MSAFLTGDKENMTNPIEDQVARNLKLSQLALHNKEIVEKAEKSINVVNELVNELINANGELLFLGNEKGERAAELVIADAEKSKRAAELMIANAEKAKRVAELVIADAEKSKRAAELVIANKELFFQAEEKGKRAAELLIANEDALYDQLTRLPNRRLFLDRFGQAMLSSRRSKTYSAILFMDLDKFKLVNDNYGHACGDYLLVEVSERIKKCVRETDTVARFGGDEYAALLTNLSSDLKTATCAVAEIAEKIRRSIADPVTVEHDGTQFVIDPQCTISVGAILFLYAQGETKTILENMIALSDKAMYQVKKAGGNFVHIEGASQ